MFHVKHSISGTDEDVEGDWRWVSGEPNNQGGYESYIMLYSKISPVGKRNDTNADNRAYNAYNVGFTNGGFICEWDYIYDGSEPPPEKDWYTLNELMSDIDEDDLRDFWEKKVNTCELTDGLGRPLWRTPDQKLSWNDINNQDSDGDGLWDGEEIVVSYIENGDSYKVWAHMYTNPCLADADGDGYGDAEDPRPLIYDKVWSSKDILSDQLRYEAGIILPYAYIHWYIDPDSLTQYEKDMFFMGIMYGTDKIRYATAVQNFAKMPKPAEYQDDIMFMQGKVYADIYWAEKYWDDMYQIVSEITSVFAAFSFTDTAYADSLTAVRTASRAIDITAGKEVVAELILAANNAGLALKTAALSMEGSATVALAALTVASGATAIKKGSELLMSINFCIAAAAAYEADMAIYGNTARKSAELGEVIGSIAAGFGLLACKDAAKEMVRELRRNRQRFEIIRIKYPNDPGGVISLIREDKGDNRLISENGFHIGIYYNGLVFCNVHPYGLPLPVWLNDFYGVGYCTVKPSKYQNLKVQY